MTKSDYYKYLEELPNYEDEYRKLFESHERYIPLDKALEYIVKQGIHISIFTYDYKTEYLDIDDSMRIDDLIECLETAKENNYTKIHFESGLEGEVAVYMEAQVRNKGSEVAKDLLKTIACHVKDKLYLHYKIEQLEKELSNATQGFTKIN